MDSKRNRTVELISYIESQGVVVNIAKNKARGNKGFFLSKCGDYRIDIAKSLVDEEVERVLVHEFAHYIHFKYDKTLKTLDFIINNNDAKITEELINLTVNSISKKDISPIFEKKDQLNNEIKFLSDSIKSNYPDFCLSKPYSKIENNLKKAPLRYLLKYDKVKYFSGIFPKLYTIDNLENDFIDISESEKFYLKLKSKQRALQRINQKIAKLNRYYNSETELFARAVESYIFNNKEMSTTAPNLKAIFDSVLLDGKIKQFNDLVNIFCYASFNEFKKV